MVNGVDAHSKDRPAEGVIASRSEPKIDLSVVTNLKSSNGTAEHTASRNALRDKAGGTRASSIDTSSHDRVLLS